MHNTFYTYTDLLDFMNDIVKNKKIWTRYGMINSFSISNIIQPYTDGYISIFIRNNNIVQNLSKYVFTLAQFKNIVFSNEVQGIEIYKKKFPLKTDEELLFDWQNLTNIEKNEYMILGNTLTDELDRFPSFAFPPNIIQPPLNQILSNADLNLKNFFKLNTGLHKFVINEEILFHVYYDYEKNSYLVSIFSNLISETKDTLAKINIYIENNDLIIQNKLETDISIRSYTSYL